MKILATFLALTLAAGVYLYSQPNPQQPHHGSAFAPIAGKVVVTDGKNATPVILNMLSHDIHAAEAPQTDDPAQKTLLTSLEVDPPERRPVW